MNNIIKICKMNFSDKVYLSKFECLVYFSLLIACFTSFTPIYAVEYKVDKDSRLQANISNNGINRIEIIDDRITEVIGNEEEYIIEGDTNLGQVFITPNIGAGKDINIRLITEKSKIIDAKLKVQNIEPQTLVLKHYVNIDNLYSGAEQIHNLVTTNKYGTNEHYLQKSNSNFDNKQLVIELIKKARLNITKQNKQEKLINREQLTCVNNSGYYSLYNKQQALKHIKFRDLGFLSSISYVLSKYSIKNESNVQIQLNEADFNSCKKNIVAIAFEHNVLASNSITNLYIVELLK